MKRSLQEIGMEGFEDEPQPPKKSPWAGRMKWKPNGNPLLHPDEEAALAAGQGAEVPIQQRPARPAPATKPTTPQHPRFQWKPEGGQVEKPNLRFMTSADVDAIMKAVRDEEAKPPHQQNAATLARLKAEAMRMMAREESQWVQRTADKMLPRVDEVKIYAASTKPYPGSTYREKEAPPKPKPGWQKACRRCGKPSGTKDLCGCQEAD